ncbi:hypothetical protein OVA26_16510 [Microbacterium sp. SL62]|uniref:glutaredoxin family protein n=1 Tax=Microbacterium sp. SL62 TaxID=2995139 RepID=UPI002275CAD4|nr:glutaredoxin domain-containing protein [Microbacterium sp. SL62]MCY1718540.1 hypothetical protein [Microbacterium sp. SL62]
MTITSIASTIDAPTEAPVLTVEVFETDNCSRCTATEKEFRRKGVPFTATNVLHDERPREDLDGLSPFDFVVTRYGREMPAVVVRDEDGQVVDWWTGGRMDKWMETIARFEQAGLLIPEHERIVD